MITQYKAIKRIVYIVIYDNISSYIEQLQYVGKNQTFLILKINKATLQQKSKDHYLNLWIPINEFIWTYAIMTWLKNQTKNNWSSSRFSQKICK